PALAGHRVLYRAPYAWLMELPGYSSVRAPARFAMLLIPCLATAAACAFAAFTARRSPRARWIAAAAAAVVILAESWPSTSVAPAPPSIASLRSGEPETPVVELPIGLVERDTAAVFRSIDHRRPLVNGYSGYTAPHYVILEIALRDEDLDALAETTRGEPLLVAVDRRFQFPRWAEALTARHAHLVADDAGTSLYRLAGARRVADLLARIGACGCRPRRPRRSAARADDSADRLASRAASASARDGGGFGPAVVDRGARGPRPVNTCGTVGDQIFRRFNSTPQEHA